MIKGNYIIDMHTHLRKDIPLHTKIASENGIDFVVYMANYPILDSIETIKETLKQERCCNALPVSAITKGLKGRELVDIKKISPYVVGFSDDGECLKDLILFKEALSTKNLILVHCEPETEYIEKYLEVLKDVKNARLHIQHVSRKESVSLIREAKKSLELSCETCPHYFSFTKEDNLRVNPQLGTKEDIEEIKAGLADNIIDCIVSDYAPKPRPRKTGIARFDWLYNLSEKLVEDKWLTEQQLFEKISENSKRILKLKIY